MATIIFDFDDTLFDTSRFKKDMFCVIKSHKVKNIDIYNSYLKASKGGYSFKKQTSILFRLYNLDRKKIM